MPPKAQTLGALPVEMLMEALHIIDSTKCPCFVMYQKGRIGVVMQENRTYLAADNQTALAC